MPALRDCFALLAMTTSVITWSGGEKMARLTGKVALITGAAGGQGTAEAELFVREEAAVVLTDIDAATGESLAQRLGGEGGKVLFVRQDVADEDRKSVV